MNETQLKDKVLRMIRRNCLICGKEFSIYTCWLKKGKNKGRFCSHQCYGKYKTRIGTRILRCKICGKEYKKVKSIKVSHTCSRKCYTKYIIGKNNPNYKGINLNKTCPICNKSFISISYGNGKNRVCCSKQCGYKLVANKHKKRIIVRCIICCKKFEMSHKHGLIRKTCSKRCMAKLYQKTLLLHRNPNWKDGKSFEPYPLGWRKTFKEQIRQRDNYKCQICGVPEIECRRKLSIHHIDYNKDNLGRNNLISLCIYCHTKTNGNRQYWKEFFYERRDKAEIESLKIS